MASKLRKKNSRAVWRHRRRSTANRGPLGNAGRTESLGGPVPDDEGATQCTTARELERERAARAVVEADSCCSSSSSLFLALLAFYSQQCRSRALGFELLLLSTKSGHCFLVYGFESWQYCSFLFSG